MPQNIFQEHLRRRKVHLSSWFQRISFQQRGVAWWRSMENVAAVMTAAQDAHLAQSENRDCGLTRKRYHLQNPTLMTNFCQEVQPPKASKSFQEIWSQGPMLQNSNLLGDIFDSECSRGHTFGFCFVLFICFVLTKLNENCLCYRLCCIIPLSCPSLIFIGLCLYCSNETVNVIQHSQTQWSILSSDLLEFSCNPQSIFST